MGKAGRLIRCDDCQFWTAPADDGWGAEYKQQLDITEYGECSVLRGAHGKFVTKDTPAFAYDAEAYRAGFRCRADFGCALFEPKS